MMTRQECEKAIADKMREIVGIYHNYNPDGKYISLCYMKEDGDETIHGNNRYWTAQNTDGVDGEDKDLPIDFFENEGASA